MLLNNTLFNVDTLLSELQKGSKGEKSALEILQIKLKAHYFDKNTSNEDIFKELDNPGFANFPRLKHVLHEIFSGHANFEIPEDLKDWEPTVTFEQLNNQYGYFNQDLSTLFQQLAVACKKMTSLIERQAHDDEMAYKLMALFYDANMSPEKNFEGISKKFDKLIFTKQDKTIKTPYHDAFVTTLHHFPKFNEVKEFDTWKAFIIKEGFKSLDIFASCATQNPAFENIKEANTFLLAQTYPRAHENPTLAQLCKELLIKNEGFNAALPVVQSGWPKKESDNLPLVDIQDKTGNYFWVKLPPQDMRALYLGNLIPGCCQHIGGHSEQCVKDGIELSDNGFYVLLKSKRAQANSNRIVDNQINDKDYDIVAQSYAWKTNNGNLCLDSIEWNQSRVTKDVIQDLMTKFSEKVFADHPDIKHINVGKGGQTPQGIYPNCLINETMKQGVLYMDAREQYQIASNMPNDVLRALKKRLKDVPRRFQDTLLYLAPYFEDIENVPAQLTSVIDNLPQIFSKINLPPRLSTDDFKKISYEEYQRMEPSQQSSISTACKIFNSQNEADLKKWLPTIPDEELVFIPLMKNQYSLEFKLEVLQRLPREHQLVTLHELNASNLSILAQSARNSELFKIILALYPTDEARLKALQVMDTSGVSLLGRATSTPESLKMILDLYPSDEARLKALQVKDTSGVSLLGRATSTPESLKMILSLYPSDEARLKALQVKDTSGVSLLGRATSTPESLKMILSLYPSDEARLKALQVNDTSGVSLLGRATSTPESLKMILDLYPSDEARLKALQVKDTSGVSLLGRATSTPESLKMILSLYPSNEACREAVTEKNNNGVSTLMLAATNPESLKIILERLPETKRLEAVTEKDNKGPSTLMLAATNPESLKIILECLPETKRLEAVTEKDNKGCSTLRRATSNPESLKIILELLPKNERLQAIKKNDYYGDSILRQAVSDSYNNVKIILDLLPENERLEAIKEKNSHEESILMRAVDYPKSLKIILERLPETKRLEAVIEKNKYDQSTLMRAVSDLFRDGSDPYNNVKIILEFLPENERLAALQTKDFKGHSVLQTCITKPELIKITLKLLPIEQSLAIIKKKDLFGNSILLNSLSNPTLFNEILNIFPVQQRIEIMKERDFYGYSILNKSTSNPQILEIVLNTLPEEIAFVIKGCLKELKPQKSEKPILSMITFIDDMKKLNSADSIKAFVHALVNNTDIEKALNALLTPPSSNSFFKSNSNEAIQKCINKLDNYWLTRIPKIELVSQITEAPDPQKKQ